MTIDSKTPIIGKTYSASEVLSELELKNAPILKFALTNPLGEKVDTELQDNHCSKDDLKKVLTDGSFTYTHETVDHIPVFSFAGKEEEARAMLNVEVELNPKQGVDDPVGLFVTPKGLPIGQYYELTSNRTLSDQEGDEVGIPMKLQEAIDAQG